METFIRKMEKDDWPAVREIYAQGIDEGISTFQTEVPDYGSWDKSHRADMRYIIMCKGEIVGWCALSYTSAREVYSGVNEVSIYIHRNYRGKGLGKQLLSFICNESEKMGIWCLYSAIFAVNEGSIRLHRSCGFREIGYREKIAKDKFGNWQNTVLYEFRNKIR